MYVYLGRGFQHRGFVSHALTNNYPKSPNTKIPKQKSSLYKNHYSTKSPKLTKIPKLVDFSNKFIFQFGGLQSGKQWLKYCTSEPIFAKLT